MVDKNDDWIIDFHRIHSDIERMIFFLRNSFFRINSFKSISSKHESIKKNRHLKYENRNQHNSAWVSLARLPFRRKPNTFRANFMLWLIGFYIAQSECNLQNTMFNSSKVVSCQEKWQHKSKITWFSIFVWKCEGLKASS